MSFSVGVAESFADVVVCLSSVALPERVCHGPARDHAFSLGQPAIPRLVRPQFVYRLEGLCFA